MHKRWIDRGLSEDAYTEFEVFEDGQRTWIPLHNSYGKYIGAQGWGENPKYKSVLNSGESLRLTLLNLHRAKKKIIEYNYAIAVEGTLDVVGLWDCGVENAVSLIGTSGMNGEKLSILLRYCDNVIIWPDMEPEGMKAARGARNSLPNSNIIVLEYDIDKLKAKDADECRQKYGPKVVKEIINRIWTRMV